METNLCNIFNEQVEDIKELLKMVENYKKKYQCKDPFFNNHYRSLLQKRELIKAFNLPTDDLILDPEGNSGPDFTSTELMISNGEMKVKWHKAKSLTTKNLGKALFDKQNDEKRRQELYEYDALMYSSMRRNGEIVFSVIVRGLDNMKLIHPLIKKAQETKIKEIEQCAKLNKRLSRDDIGIDVYDIIHALNDDQMTIIHLGVKTTKEKFLSLVKPSRSKNDIQ